MARVELGPGFPRETVEAVEPYLDKALALIEAQAGDDVYITFPSPVVAMTAEEIAEGEAVRGPGHELGAGHGLWDPKEWVAKVNASMSPEEVLENVVHEFLHMVWPDEGEVTIDAKTAQILGNLGLGDGEPFTGLVLSHRWPEWKGTPAHTDYAAVPRYAVHEPRGPLYDVTQGVQAYRPSSFDRSWGTSEGDSLRRLYRGSPFDPEEEGLVYLELLWGGLGEPGHAGRPGEPAAILDVARMDPDRLRLTGQAEGYAVHVGDPPLAALVATAEGREEARRLIAQLARRDANPKRIGGNVYAHRSDRLTLGTPQVRRAAKRLPPGAAWDVAKLAPQAVTFSRVPGFDAEAEPAIVEQWRVDDAGRVRHSAQGDNPPILHRKELMVADGYEGFDVGRAQRRTARYAGRVDSSRIGRRDGWTAERERIGLQANPRSIPFGLCYPFAFNKAKERVRAARAKGEPPEALDATDDFRVVHGFITDPWKGERVGHAWVVDAGRVYDAQTSVTRPGGIELAAYEKEYAPEVVRSFSAWEILDACGGARHYGPFDQLRNPMASGPMGRVLQRGVGRLNSDRVVTLNMGMGRDSMAMFALLLEGRLEVPGWGAIGVEDVDAALFSDTGCEWPHTYELVQEVSELAAEAGLEYMVLEKGGRFHPLPPIMEDYMARSTVASMGKGDCTDKHKIAPIKRFLAERARERFGVPTNGAWTTLVKKGLRPPHLTMVGFVGGEDKRIKRAAIVGTPEQEVLGPWTPWWAAERAAMGRPLFVTETYPLYYMDVSKEDEVPILARWGWEGVKKSGCWICPWQPVSWFWALRETDPVRFAAVVAYEQRAVDKNPQMYLAAESGKAYERVVAFVGADSQKEAKAAGEPLAAKRFGEIGRVGQAKKAGGCEWLVDVRGGAAGTTAARARHGTERVEAEKQGEAKALALEAARCRFGPAATVGKAVRVPGSCRWQVYLYGERLLLPELVERWRGLNQDATVDLVLDKAYSRQTREKLDVETLMGTGEEAQEAICAPEAIDRIMYEFEDVGGGAEQARLFNPEGGGTAISREFPAPAGDVLLAERIRRDTALDLGSGKTAWGPARYDPNHPGDDDALEYDYDVVTAFYVLNVIAKPQERRELLKLAASRLLPGGRFYAAVRTDDPCEGQPSRKTTRGTQVCKSEEGWRRELSKAFPSVEAWARGNGYVTFLCGGGTK